MNRSIKACLLPLFFLSVAFAAPEPKEATITVRKDGSILFEKQIVSAATLSKALTDAGYGAGSHVLLKSDADASYETVNAVLDALDNPKHEVTFEVLEEEKMKGPPPSKPGLSLAQLSDLPLKPFPTTAIGIKAQADLDETHQYFTAVFGQSPILHLTNDTGHTLFVFTPFGDTRSGKATIHAEFVLVEKPHADSPTPIHSWLQRQFLFSTEPAPPRLVYAADPTDEFDVTLDLTTLSDPKNPHSKRLPLPKGMYSFSLELYDAEKVARAVKTGLFPSPLLSFYINIK